MTLVMMLLWSIFGSRPGWADLPDSVLLEDIPAESTVALTEAIDVDLSKVAANRNFILNFYDGRMEYFAFEGIPSVPGKPGIAGLRGGSGMPAATVSNCEYSDNAADYGPESVIRLKAGDLFTVRSHRYGRTYFDPEDKTGAEMKRINLFNTPSAEANRLPSLSCLNSDGSKPSIGDLRRITAGLIKILPAATR